MRGKIPVTHNGQIPAASPVNEPVPAKNPDFLHSFLSLYLIKSKIERKATNRPMIVDSNKENPSLIQLTVFA
ncbi:MAG: hypothetical protein AABW90_02235 [Nanoarchaeota archaeon]